MKINCIIKGSPLWKQAIEWKDATLLQKEDANLRTMKNNEIVLDCDKHGEKQSSFSEVVAKLTEDSMKFTAYQHREGEDSGHVHCYFDRDITNEERAVFISHYGCDPAKASKSTFISMEDRPHFKTGEIKTLKADFRGINAVPEWLTEEIKKSPKKEPISVGDVSRGTAEGNRNENAFKLATFHRKGGATLEETIILIQDMNKKNNPPLTDREIETIVKSAYRGDKAYNVYFKENPKTGEEIPNRDKYFNIVRYIQGEKAGEIKTKVFVPKRLGDAIIKEIPIKTLKGSNESYYYSNGLYLENAEGKIAERVAYCLDEDFKKNHLSEVLSYIKSVTQTDTDELRHDFINLKNGMLNVITDEFIDHNPDIFTIRQLPVDYIPDADCPFFREKLSEKTTPDIMLTFQEMSGYCLLPGQKFERAFLLYGPPRTMKSTSLYAISSVLGEDNIKAFSLHNLIEDRFAPAYLFGVMANIAPDISGKELKDTSFFMAWTGGDPITSGKKGKHYITFRPDCKPIFSCNKVPGTRNRSSAFYRRWLMLPFNKQTNKSELITDMREKINDELPGILNWMISGLRRLLENDDFTMRPTMDEIKDMYEKNSDSITSFIYNKIDETDSNSETKRDIYRAYVEYCKENELQPENVIYFGKWFRETTGCGTCKKGPSGFSVPAYSGISLKTKRKNDLSEFDSKEEVS